MRSQMPASVSYFPGCSLATSAKENNLSLINFCHHIGVELVELKDWNCCGSSSAHSIDADLAFKLAARNLSMAPPGRPLLIACPSCLLRLGQVHLHLRKNSDLRNGYEALFDRPFDTGLEIIHFFELFRRSHLNEFIANTDNHLNGLKFVSYY